MRKREDLLVIFTGKEELKQEMEFEMTPLFILLLFFLQANRCPPGYYCPEGTGYRFSHPCPVGFYRNLSAAVSVQDCSVCFSGHFCDELGLGNPKVCPNVGETFS